MEITKALTERAGNVCELCGCNENLTPFLVLPKRVGGIDDHVLTCSICASQIGNSSQIDSNHWRCLNDAMWSQEPAVQVVAWRMLNVLKSEGWPVELLEMMYLNDETLNWAKADGSGIAVEDKVVHKDCNGAVLNAGDTVVLIKDLNVKGSSLVAKRGTAVRNILLDPDNEAYIEGKVDGQKIVIITEFVKKSN